MADFLNYEKIWISSLEITYYVQYSQIHYVFPDRELLTCWMNKYLVIKKKIVRTECYLQTGLEWQLQLTAFDHNVGEIQQMNLNSEKSHATITYTHTWTNLCKWLTEWAESFTSDLRRYEKDNFRPFRYCLTKSTEVHSTLNILHLTYFISLFI